MAGEKEKNISNHHSPAVCYMEPWPNFLMLPLMICFFLEMYFIKSSANMLQTETAEVRHAYSRGL